MTPLAKPNEPIYVDPGVGVIIFRAHHADWPYLCKRVTTGRTFMCADVRSSCIHLYGVSSLMELPADARHFIHQWET